LYSLEYKIYKKVCMLCVFQIGTTTLNIKPNERLFADLVSVDVADNLIGPKITDIRKHHRRRKHDTEPCLEDFVTKGSKHKEDCWPNFPTIDIPFIPVQMYDGKSVLLKVSKWQQMTEKLSLFENS
jgi:hypothetical protein